MINNQLNSMKIVLIHKKEIKLFNDKLSFDLLAKFASTEFILAPKSIQLTFKDDQGDNITILSDEDLDVMQAVFQNKQYMKVTVEGTIQSAEEPKDLKATEMSETVEQPQEKKSEPTVESGDNIFSKGCRGRGGRGRKEGGHGPHHGPHHGSHSKEHGSPRHKHGSGHGKEKCMKMKNFFNEIITKLVDQRINSMLPCLKERILKGEEPVSAIVSDLIHNGVDCKGCAMKPVTGIRYKCATCVNFDLCETCEQKIEHEHPLLKIKKVIEENKEEENEFHEFKKIFRQMFKHHRRGSSSSGSREKGHRQWKGHKHMKKIWGLATLFGGQPEQYAQYAEKHEDLLPKDVFKKYAQENGISEEVFQEKFTNMRCQKLSGFFGKAPEHYKEFVKENIDLTQKDLMNALYDQGIEKRENKKRCWWGRKFNFGEEFKEESPRKEQSMKKEKLCSKERKHGQKRSEKSRSPVEDRPADRKAKGAILMKMLEIFGTEKQKDYVKFIDKFFALGEEKIIDLWIQQ